MKSIETVLLLYFYFGQSFLLCDFIPLFILSFICLLTHYFLDHSLMYLFAYHYNLSSFIRNTSTELFIVRHKIV